VAHVCVSDLVALRELICQRTFVLVSGSTSHMRDIVREYTKKRRPDETLGNAIQRSALRCCRVEVTRS
jgi:hypothetical protein